MTVRDESGKVDPARLNIQRGPGTMAEHENTGIRIAVILGTARPGNYTAKALALVIDEIEKRDAIALDVIEPAKMNLPAPGVDADSPDIRADRD